MGKRNRKNVNHRNNRTGHYRSRSAQAQPVVVVEEVRGPLGRRRLAWFLLLAMVAAAAVVLPMRLLDIGPLGLRFGIGIALATIIWGYGLWDGYRRRPTLTRRRVLDQQ